VTLGLFTGVIAENYTLAVCLGTLERKVNKAIDDFLF